MSILTDFPYLMPVESLDISINLTPTKNRARFKVGFWLLRISARIMGSFHEIAWVHSKTHKKESKP